MLHKKPLISPRLTPVVCSGGLNGSLLSSLMPLLHIIAVSARHQPRYEIQLGRSSRFFVGLNSRGPAEFNKAGCGLKLCHQQSLEVSGPPTCRSQPGAGTARAVSGLLGLKCTSVMGARGRRRERVTFLKLCRCGCSLYYHNRDLHRG